MLISGKPEISAPSRNAEERALRHRAGRQSRDWPAIFRKFYPFGCGGVHRPPVMRARARQNGRQRMGNQSGFAGINGCPAIIAPKQGTCRHMTDHEAQAAWRLFTLNWIPLALMGLTLALCLALTGFSLRIESLPLPFGAAALFAGAAYVYAFARRRDFAGALHAGFDGAARSYQRADGAAHLYRGRRRPADAGRQPRLSRPHTWARLASLLSISFTIVPR